MSATILALLTLALFTAPADASSWDDRAFAALQAEDRSALRSLAAEYRKLSPEARRELPIRVRPGSVEFAFRGEFHGDEFSHRALEYLVSGPQKAYESLLVTAESEMRRTRPLGELLEKRTEGDRRKWLSMRLVWAEDGRPMASPIGDVIAVNAPDERAEFFATLQVVPNGFRTGPNIAADPAALPKGRVPAVLLVTVRVTPGD